MKRNKNVVYTGKVGSRMKPKKHGVSLTTKKVKVRCTDGPLKNHDLFLQEDRTTMYFKFDGVEGRYRDGKWERKDANGGCVALKSIVTR